MRRKKTIRANLEPYRKIFFELGLVITTACALLAMNFKTQERSNTILPNQIYQVNVVEEERIQDYVIEKITPPPAASPQTMAVEIEVVDDSQDIIEDQFLSTETDQSEKVIVADIVQPETIEEVEEIEEIVEDIPFAIIEDAPIYPGCEKYINKKRQRACLNRSLKKHVSKHFNPTLASDLGLTTGVKKIYIQFKITTTGGIEIEGARAPHKRLEKEARRVIELLPQMEPGKQRGRPVNVTYMLPITFSVE